MLPSQHLRATEGNRREGRAWSGEATAQGQLRQVQAENDKLRKESDAAKSSSGRLLPAGRPWTRPSRPRMSVSRTSAMNWWRCESPESFYREQGRLETGENVLLINKNYLKAQPLLYLYVVTTIHLTN